MKKFKKTYGIDGLLESHIIINSNGTMMKIQFTNGSTSAYGTTPAVFTTDNKFTQVVIENSNEYKKGRIRLVRCVEIPCAEPASCSASKVAEADSEQKEFDLEDYTKVEVASKAEAVEYLKENFGSQYTAVKLKSASAFESACRECKVSFTFPN